MKPVRVGLLGLGTVGAGTVAVLRRNGDEIARRAGREIQVVRAAVRDPAKPRDCDLDGVEVGADAEAVVDDPGVDIVVELMGGLEPARSLVGAAIDNGKHVVTANKALIASCGNELFAAAQKAAVMVAFEAAVAGGIPIIKTIREALSGNRVEMLAGIINGTSNYILSEMSSARRAFDAVLADAQALGYAEADPSFDIDGTDAAHKLTILVSIAFGIPLQFERAYLEGIDVIGLEDIRYAEQLGYRIKHLGLSRKGQHGVELRVHPTLIKKEHMLANVDGVMNAVLVHGDAVGPMLLYGAGAGAEPTASAVVADLVDVVRALTTDPENRVPHLAFQPSALADLPIVPMEAVESAYYLRMSALDQPGVLAEVTGILGARRISIEAIQQQEPAADAERVPIVFLTHKVPERAMNAAIAEIEALPSIDDRVVRIRVEHF
jgi:homoserine dehydrogenase